MSNSPPITLLTKNWLLKILALIIGISLWYFVVGEDQIDITITVPIEVHNLPAELVIANQFKKDIEVSIRGPRRIIQEMRQANISRPINLAQAEAGAVVITNDGKSIPFPQGITVLRLQPTNITLLIDQLFEKNFSINPVLEGEPSSGFELKAIKLDPDQLTVTGPKTLLEQQTALKTVVINLDSMEKPEKLQIPLDLNNNILQLIGETIVTVTIVVEERILIKTVRGIPINVKESDIPYKTEPAMVTVEAGIAENLIRDTPELAMLFRAVVSPKVDDTTDTFSKVNVNGITVPGHNPISVINVRPEKVKLIPVKVLGEKAE